MKILVVEDENALRDMVCESLQKEMYRVESAPDFKTALSKIQEYDYDCVLLDVMLPDGNGLDILAELKRMRKPERVIVLSAKDSVEDKIKGLDLGRRLSGKTFSSGRIACTHQIGVATQKC